MGILNGLPVGCILSLCIFHLFAYVMRAIGLETNGLTEHLLLSYLAVTVAELSDSIGCVMDGCDEYDMAGNILWQTHKPTVSGSVLA